MMTDQDLLLPETEQLQQSQPHAWEEQYKRSWDVLREDSQGTLNTALLQVMQQHKRRRRIDALTSAKIQRGIVRHLVLILDVSLAMASRDLKPTYFELTVTLLRQWLMEFFDQNPISQLCLVISKDGLAQRITEPSGNPLDHLKALDDYMDISLLSGEPSLQNSLDLACSVLLRHGRDENSSREILTIMASMTSRDPDDIQDTVSKLKNSLIRCSVISLTAEVNICKVVCNKTGGEYKVSMNENHFRELLWAFLPPPPILVEKSSARLILMGFPNNPGSIISLCACHDKLEIGGYMCPRCGTKNCDLPSICSVCSLKLISSPHLARSYHHLFPISAYLEHSPTSVGANECFACKKALKIRKPETTIKLRTKTTLLAISDNFETISANLSVLEENSYQCPDCKYWFCLDCDLFIHEALHNCPGCF